MTNRPQFASRSRRRCLQCVPALVLFSSFLLLAGASAAPPPPAREATLRATRSTELHLAIAIADHGPTPDSISLTVFAAGGGKLYEKTVRYEADLVLSDLPLLIEGSYELRLRDDRGRRGDLTLAARDFGARTNRIELVLPMAMAAPPAPSFPGAREASPSARPEDEIGWQQVFFATDREPVAGKDLGEAFGPDRSEAISYGSCWISFPPDHRMGKIEKPSLFRFEIHLNPLKHVMLRQLAVTPKDSFFVQLDHTLESVPERRLLLFVHGYNVDFEGATLRAGQLAWDVQFPGAAVLYTWPSRGSIKGYLADEATCDWSAPHFADFLDDLIQRTSAEAIEIVAHSMGSRIVTAGLRELQDRNLLPGKVQVSELVLAAPDIDADVFRDFAAKERVVSGRITLYGSSKDKAIEASQKIHAAPRAGEGGDHLVVVPRVETVDASAIATDFLDHSYFGDNRSVITDLHELLRGRPIQQRCCLTSATKSGLPYWVFRP